jgi:hypothetical protein
MVLPGDDKCGGVLDLGVPDDADSKKEMRRGMKG